MDTYLRTARLVLRRFRSDDVDLLVELDSDPRVMHAITGGVPTPRAEIDAVVLPAFLRHYELWPGFGFFAASLRRSGEFVGWFHLRPAEEDPPDEVELGYRLRYDAWGHGYASEGSRALVDHAFRALGVRRVHAETMVVHQASRAVMEHAGLHLVRIFHADWPYPIPGDEHGDVEYALTREAWARSTGLGV